LALSGMTGGLVEGKLPGGLGVGGGRGELNGGANNAVNNVLEAAKAQAELLQGGAVHVEIQLTHSLKAPGFNP
jgi:hypothetical protein